MTTSDYSFSGFPTPSFDGRGDIEKQLEFWGVFQEILEWSFEAVFVVQSGRVIYGNPRMMEITGLTCDRLQDLPFLDLVYKLDRQAVLSRHRRTLKKPGAKSSLAFRLMSGDGSMKWIEAKIVGILWDKKPAGLFLGLDMTEAKRATEELVAQAKHLRELNTALKVFLEHRDLELKEYKKSQVGLLEKLVRPYLEQALRGGLEEREKVLLQAALSNLAQMDSPDSDRFAGLDRWLTRAEMEVADLIRREKTTKEIASLLNCSPETVSVHRRHIRKKLGICNKKIRLRDFLYSLYYSHADK